MRDTSGARNEQFRWRSRITPESPPGILGQGTGGLGKDPTMAAESGSESIEINATPEAIFQVMTDIDSFPKWMDEFKEATVLNRDEQGRPSRASFELDAKIKTVRYVLAYSYPEGGLAWESEEGGDVKLIKGSYIMSPSVPGGGPGGDPTTVTYNFEIDPGFPVPSFIRRQAVKMIVARALGGLKKRVESGA